MVLKNAQFPRLCLGFVSYFVSSSRGGHTGKPPALSMRHETCSQYAYDFSRYCTCITNLNNFALIFWTIMQENAYLKPCPAASHLNTLVINTIILGAGLAKIHTTVEIVKLSAP